MKNQVLEKEEINYKENNNEYRPRREKRKKKACIF